MNTLHVQTTTQPAVLAKKLFKLERCGRYSKALEALADIWPDSDLDPKIGGFEPRDAAEILLRCGSLIGFHGHISQIPGSQLKSKNLLSNAHERFLGLEIIEKAAECENHLALAFWRTGEFNEAENWVDEALGHKLPSSSDARLYSHIAKSMIDISHQRHRENLKNCERLESDFRKYGDAFLTGSFYTNIGLSLKNLGRKSEALGHFELAKFFHQQSRHKIYLGTVENNLAGLYKDAGKFRQAHESVDIALRINRQIKDKTREGSTLDTKALIYFAESKYGDALRTVEKALVILRKSENSGYLIETLLTKAKILLYDNNFTGAVLSLIDAVDIARVQTGEESVMRLINEFETALYERNAPQPDEDAATECLQLIIPPSIDHYSYYSGIWIKNTGLEAIGLAQGSLAILAEDKISRGDLVAISEMGSDMVICGFYDADFGIVGIEAAAGEPQIFDEKDIKVLGRIIGVCDPNKKEDGRMVVRALNL
jgi:tetratricopeptide (TPR) repeat protein